MIPPDIRDTIDFVIRYYEDVHMLNDAESEAIGLTAVKQWMDTLPAAPAPDSRELLPCPFCGENGVIHVDYVLGPNEPLYSPMCEHLSYWYAHRFQPGHKGHPKCGGGIGASFTTRAEAIAAWNRRTTLVARPTE